MFAPDSGPFGTTTLAKGGSVFCVSPDDRILTCLARQTLAHPCGLALAPDQTFFVAEANANRLLRFFQYPRGSGVWHSAVFYQFSGGQLPVAVASDFSRGTLFVARADFARGTGCISIISAAGKHLSDIECAEMPTGLCLGP